MNTIGNKKILVVALMSLGVMACSSSSDDDSNQMQGSSHNLNPSGYYDNNGMIYFKGISNRFADTLTFSNGTSIVADLNTQWGAIDSYGTQLIPHKYNQLYKSDNGMFHGKTGKTWQYLNKDGTPAFAGQFDKAYGFDSHGLAVVEQNGKQFFVDTTGKSIAEAPAYQRVFGFANDLAVVRKDGKEGYIDRTGTEVIAPKYAFAYNFQDNKAAIAQKADSTEVLLNNRGEELGTFERLYAFADGWALAQKDGKYGFVDDKGQWQISNQYKRLYIFAKNNLAPAQDATGNWGYLDKTTKTAKNGFIYKDVYSFNDQGFARVRNAAGKWGAIDAAGAFKLPAQYDYILRADDKGLAPMIQGKKMGFVNMHTATEVVAAKYEEVNSAHYGLAAFKQNGKYGYVNAEGTEVVPAQYEQANDFSHYGAIVKKDGKWGTLARGTGKVRVPAIYDALGETIGENYVVAAQKDGKWGYVSYDGSVVVPFEYDQAAPFGWGGLAMVAKGGKYGFINVKNQVVIGLQYDNAGNFSNSAIAPVQKGGKWGYVDSSNNTIIDFKYTAAQQFGLWDGGAVVTDNAGDHFINDRGTVLFSYPKIKTYAEKYQGNTDLIPFQDATGNWGYINDRGRVVIKAQYKDAHYFVDNMAAVQKSNNQWVYIDAKGEPVFASADEYDSVVQRKKGQQCFAVTKGGVTEYIDYAGEKSEYCNQ